MAAFTELADVRRAAEWTEATSRWLATLPAAVQFTGICRVHRSQVLQRKGAWALADLSNIFAKLGVASRTQAAAYAFEHGLGEQAARAMLAEAGFGGVAVHEAPGDPPTPCS
jgi:hypothetical protein